MGTWMLKVTPSILSCLHLPKAPEAQALGCLHKRVLKPGETKIKLKHRLLAPPSPSRSAPRPKSEHMEDGATCSLAALHALGATQLPQHLTCVLKMKPKGELNSKEGRREATWEIEVALPLPPQQNVLPSSAPWQT